MRDQRQVFQEIAAYDRSARGVNLTGVDPEQVTAMHVSADYFHLFGAPIGNRPDVHRGRGPSERTASRRHQRRTLASAVRSRPRSAGKSLALRGEPCESSACRSAFAAHPSAEAWLPMHADPRSTDRL